MTKNFYIYVDREGKMPQLRTSEWECESHPYFVRYINDNPISYHGPIEVVSDNVTRDSVWCYRTNSFVPTRLLESI